MQTLRTFALALALALAFALAFAFAPAQAPAQAAPPLLQLPAFDGEFSGDFFAPLHGADAKNALAFHWHILAESPAGAPGTRRARLDIAGHGARVTALAELDLATGVTHWKIENAEASLAETFPALAPLLPANPALAGLAITGTLAISGAGTIDTAGNWTANLAADLRDATLRDDTQGLLAEGLTAHAEFPALPSLKTAPAPAQPLTIRRLTHNATQLTLEDIRTTLALDEAGPGATLRIHAGDTQARAAGGTIAIDAFDLAPAAPAIATTLRARDIESAEFAKLLPGAVTEVRGKFSGNITLAWNPADGLKPGNGQLTLQKSADRPMLRLASTPGFLTANMDKRLYFLPPSLGFLRNWLSLKNPAYDTLKQIEEGRQPIAVENITIKFIPEGDGSGRSAIVAIEAKPTDPKSPIQRLRINVNVSGPLASVIQMLATDRLQISF